MTTSTDLRRVLLVEDHDLLSQALSLALRAEGLDAKVIHPSGDLHLVSVVQGFDPDLVLLDLDLGPETSRGELLAGTLVDLGARVLVVTGVEEPRRIKVALDAGAEGFVHKSSGMSALMEAILRVARGEAATPSAALKELTSRIERDARTREHNLQDFARLSDREQEVLARLMQGDSVQAIAASNVVSEATVRTQVRGVLTKLGVNSQLAAVALAHRLRWRQEEG